jgi:hypothetical protein
VFLCFLGGVRSESLSCLRFLAGDSEFPTFRLGGELSLSCLLRLGGDLSPPRFAGD